MLAPIAALAARFDMPKWVVALLAGLVLLALVAGGFGLWLADVKRDAVREDRAKANVEALQADRTATRAADEADAKAAEKARAEAETIRKDIANATTSHPEAARAPVGPAISAVTDSLRSRPR